MSKSIWAAFFGLTLLTIAFGTVFGQMYNGDCLYIFKIVLDKLGQFFHWVQGLFESIFAFFGGIDGWFGMPGV